MEDFESGRHIPVVQHIPRLRQYLLANSRVLRHSYDSQSNVQAIAKLHCGRKIPCSWLFGRIRHDKLANRPKLLRRHQNRDPHPARKQLGVCPKEATVFVSVPPLADYEQRSLARCPCEAFDDRPAVMLDSKPYMTLVSNSPNMCRDAFTLRVCQSLSIRDEPLQSVTMSHCHREVHAYWVDNYGTNRGSARPAEFEGVAQCRERTFGSADAHDDVAQDIALLLYTHAFNHRNHKYRIDVR